MKPILLTHPLSFNQRIKGNTEMGCNIVEQAKEVCQDDRILAIISGFHLRKPPIEQLSGTIAYLQQANVENLYA